jgi:hypothetical protein
MRRFRNGTIVEGEIRDWIPIGGTEGFQGNVLRYGIGVSRKCYDNGSLSVLPVVETVAWSVLSGDVFTPDEGLRSAETTIVNMKFGARFNHAPKCCGGATRTLYVGYGKALTDDRWYNHTIRAEYGLRF